MDIHSEACLLSCLSCFFSPRTRGFFKTEEQSNPREHSDRFYEKQEIILQKERFY